MKLSSSIIPLIVVSGANASPFEKRQAGGISSLMGGLLNGN